MTKRRDKLKWFGVYHITTDSFTCEKFSHYPGKAWLAFDASENDRLDILARGKIKFDVELSLAELTPGSPAYWAFM